MPWRRRRGAKELTPPPVHLRAVSYMRIMVAGFWYGSSVLSHHHTTSSLFSDYRNIQSCCRPHLVVVLQAAIRVNPGDHDADLLCVRTVVAAAYWSPPASGERHNQYPLLRFLIVPSSIMLLPGSADIARIVLMTVKIDRYLPCLWSRIKKHKFETHLDAWGCGDRLNLPGYVGCGAMPSYIFVGSDSRPGFFTSKLCSRNSVQTQSPNFVKNRHTSPHHSFMTAISMDGS